MAYRKMKKDEKSEMSRRGLAPPPLQIMATAIHSIHTHTLHSGYYCRTSGEMRQKQQQKEVLPTSGAVDTKICCYPILLQSFIAVIFFFVIICIHSNKIVAIFGAKQFVNLCLFFRRLISLFPFA